MLIIALVLALIGLVALVFAVVTSNALVAWVCIGASVLGVVLLIVDAVRERQQLDMDAEAEDETVDYPEEASDEGEQNAAGIDESSEDSDSGVTEKSAVPADRGGDESAK